VDFLATDRRAVDFLATDRRAVDFLATDLRVFLFGILIIYIIKKNSPMIFYLRF
jgi:hypothetical protein